jgi:hypothetical protein
VDHRLRTAILGHLDKHYSTALLDFENCYFSNKKPLLAVRL